MAYLPGNIYTLENSLVVKLSNSVSISMEEQPFDNFEYWVIGST